jgi:hypothetical protein
VSDYFFRQIRCVITNRAAVGLGPERQWRPDTRPPFPPEEEPDNA